MPFPFNGQLLVIPGTASQIIDSATQGGSSPASGVVGIVGAAAMGGGKAPKTPLAFTDAQSSRRAWGTGPLADGIDRAFAHGAGKVIGVRVNPATPSQFALLDAGSAPCLNLLTNDSGAYTAAVRVKVDAGTAQGLKVTVQTPSVGPTAGNTIVADNLYAAPITLTYVGSGTNPTYTVTASNLATAVTGDTIGVVTLPFSGYPTIQALVDALNATGKWSATLSGGPTVGQLAASILDGATAVAATSAVALTANRNAVQVFLNSPAAGGVLVASAGALGSLPAATSVNQPAAGNGYQSLTGGSDGTTIASDWTAALATLQSQDADIICVMSGDPTVHAAAQAHVDFMCGQGEMERVAILGGYLGETLTSPNAGITGSKGVQARASALNDPNCALVWPGVLDFDWQGVQAYRDPFYAAADVAGLLAGGGIADAATRQPIKASGLELQGGLPISRLLVATALQSGVLCLEQATSNGATVFRVAQSLTTWLNDQNYAKREISTVRGKYYVVRSARAALEALIGKKSQGSLETLATSTITDVLTQLTLGGILVGAPGNPSFKDVSAKITGDVMLVAFTCAVAIPCNYIPITCSLNAYTG